jgi:hypothetical protein
MGSPKAISGRIVISWRASTDELAHRRLRKRRWWTKPRLPLDRCLPGSYGK